jgi:large subunit ribosomal protein L29
MKSSEIRKMTSEEIAKAVKGLREELGTLNFKHRIRPLEDTSKLKKIRKDIARIETISRQNRA